MCGRYTGPLDRDAAAATAKAVWREEDPVWRPNYNVCPKHRVPTVIQESRRVIDRLEWGWKVPWKRGPFTNAWGPEAADKRNLATPFREQRCALIASGFYEWRTDPDGKTPIYYTVKGQEVAFIAGLWQDQRDAADGPWVRRVTMLLTDSNEVVRSTSGHEMMPVFLGARELEAWMDPDAEVETLRSLCVPLPDGRLSSRQVSRKVNSNKSSGPELIMPV